MKMARLYNTLLLLAATVLCSQQLCSELHCA